MMDPMQAKRESEAITGVSNVTFDLITTLENKLQGIAAMEEYKMDCEDAGDTEAMRVFDELQRQEIDDVTRLKGLVAMRLSQEPD